MKEIICSLLMFAVGGSIALASEIGSQPSTSGPSNPSANITLTPQDWQELRIARQAALKANPEFSAKAAQLAAKMREFQAKLDAAMIKANPAIAPVVAKLEPEHSGKRLPAVGGQ